MRAEVLAALLLVAAAPAPAQTAAPAVAPAPDFGTLFHSADERGRLDKLRRGEPPEPPEAQRGPPSVTGFVQRSDGRNTVWIDGRPVPVESPRAGPLFDPRVVRDLPPKPEPAPEPKGEAKAEAKEAKEAAPKAERKEEVKR